MADRLSSVRALVLATFLVIAAGANCPTSSNVNGISHTYAQCVNLPNGATFSWSYFTSSGQLSGMYVCTPEKPYGWCAWGISPTGRMPKSSALVAYGDAGGQPPKVNQYALGFYKTPPLGGDLSVNTSAASVTNSGNTITLVFVINLNSSQTTVFHVFGIGPGVSDYAQGILQPHIPGNNYGASINFLSGASAAGAVLSNHQDYKNTHGALAGASWGVIMPIGAIVARHGKHFFDPFWFYLHAALQASGYVIGTVAFGYGIQLHSWPIQHYTNHFAIGITLFVLASLQIITPILKPDKDSPSRFGWWIAHAFLGYSTIILSVVNIFIGFHALQTYGGWKTAYIVFISIYAGVFIILEVLTLFLAKKKKTEEYEGEEKPATD